jgi:hypothetical protein
MQQTGCPIVLIISDGPPLQARTSQVQTKAESELIMRQVERNCRRMWARNARAWLQGRGGHEEGGPSGRFGGGGHPGPTEDGTSTMRRHSSAWITTRLDVAG